MSTNILTKTLFPATSDPSHTELDPKREEAARQVRRRLEVLCEKQKAAGKEVSYFPEEAIAVLNQIMYEFMSQRSGVVRSLSRLGPKPSLAIESYILFLLARKMFYENTKDVTVQEMLDVLPVKRREIITNAVLKIREVVLQNRQVYLSYMLVDGKREDSFELMKHPLAGKLKED